MEPDPSIIRLRRRDPHKYAIVVDSTTYSRIAAIATLRGYTAGDVVRAGVAAIYLVFSPTIPELQQKRKPSPGPHRVGEIKEQRR